MILPLAAVKLSPLKMEVTEMDQKSLGLAKEASELNAQPAFTSHNPSSSRRGKAITDTLPSRRKLRGSYVIAFRRTPAVRMHPMSPDLNCGAARCQARLRRLRHIYPSMRSHLPRPPSSDGLHRYPRRIGRSRRRTQRKMNWFGLFFGASGGSTEGLPSRLRL